MMYEYNGQETLLSGALFDLVDRDHDNKIDWIDITDILTVFNHDTQDFFLKPSTAASKLNETYLTTSDIHEIKDFTDMIISLCNYGKQIQFFSLIISKREAGPCHV